MQDYHAQQKTLPCEAFSDKPYRKDDRTPSPENSLPSLACSWSLQIADYEIEVKKVLGKSWCFLGADPAAVATSARGRTYTLICPASEKKRSRHVHSVQGQYPGDAFPSTQKKERFAGWPWCWCAGSDRPGNASAQRPVPGRQKARIELRPHRAERRGAQGPFLTCQRPTCAPPLLSLRTAHRPLCALELEHDKPGSEPLFRSRENGVLMLFSSRGAVARSRSRCARQLEATRPAGPRTRFLRWPGNCQDDSTSSAPEARTASWRLASLVLQMQAASRGPRILMVGLDACVHAGGRPKIFVKFNAASRHFFTKNGA